MKPFVFRSRGCTAELCRPHPETGNNEKPVIVPGFSEKPYGSAAPRVDGFIIAYIKGRFIYHAKKRRCNEI